MRNHSYENEFHLHDHFHANQSHFHFNGFARRLVLKLRQRATRKWPIIILKNSDLDSFQNTNIKITHRVDEWTRN